MRVPRLRMRSALPWLAACCVLTIPSTATAACRDQDARTQGGASGSGRPAEVLATLCVINEERAAHGVALLAFDPQLTEAAYLHAADLIAHRIFSHTGSSGSSLGERVMRAGYPDDPDTWAAGETLGWGSAALATPRAIVDAWLASPEHREVLLDARYTEVGIMVLAGAPTAAETSSAATYVADFGTRTEPRPPRFRSRSRCRATARIARRSARSRRQRRCA